MARVIDIYLLINRIYGFYFFFQVSSLEIIMQIAAIWVQVFKIFYF